jgi:capsule polysaccharide export protein KpsC/LpsZ
VEIRAALLAKGVVTAGLNLMGSLGTLAKKARNERNKRAVSLL